MADLTNDEIHALGRSVGLDIKEPELTQVGYSLNAILEAMAAIDVPGRQRRGAIAVNSCQCGGA